MTYQVNKQKCTGCQICLSNCPGATKIGTDNKAQVIDQEKLENCGGESICPAGAIEKTSRNEESETKTQSQSSYQPPMATNGRGMGRGSGMGRGTGQGMGRGLGQGPRDGSGMGRGRNQ